MIISSLNQTTKVNSYKYWREERKSTAWLDCLE